MNFKFEKLIVWQKAMELGEDVHKLTYSFPKSYTILAHRSEELQILLL